MKKFLSLPFRAIICFITIITIIGTIINACKKIDSRQDEPLSLNEQKFFYYRQSSEPHVQALTAFMKRVNDKDHFVEKTVRQIGYPYWDKSISIKGISDDRGASDSAIITYIPFVRERESHVNACLIIKATERDTAFRYLCDWQYANPDSTGWQPRNVFHIFSKMDYHVFERTRFKINDEIILSQQEKDYIDSLGLSFDTINVVCTMESQQSSERSNLWMLTTWCDNVYTCVQTQMAGFKSSSSQVVSGCPSGTWLVTEVCTDTWVYIPSSGDGPGGGGGGGNGSPGGGGGSSPPPPPCNNGPGRNNLIDPCGPGWEPAPPLTLAQQLQAWDNAIIIDQSVRQCVKDIIDHIKSIKTGAIADMIRTLSGEIPGFNWTIKEVSVTTPANADAVTSIGQNGNHDAITELNQTVLANATNISMARTIIHEAIHAFIYDYVYNNAALTPAEKAQIMALPFSQKLKKYFKLVFQTATNSQHNAMVKDFHDDIRDALKILCPLLGINLTGTDLNQFCSDMAWGGLQDLDTNSPWNDPNILTDEDRERITKRLDIELNNLPGFTGYVNGYYINLTRQGTKACP